MVRARAGNDARAGNTAAELGCNVARGRNRRWLRTPPKAAKATKLTPSVTRRVEFTS
jgi:hypothetical protein